MIQLSPENIGNVAPENTASSRHCVVCHVLYRSDCDRSHDTSLSLSLFTISLFTISLSPSLLSRSLARSPVIKYISPIDKCKMNDAPQLQRSRRLRYGKSLLERAACHRSRHATSIFLLYGNSESKVVYTIYRTGIYNPIRTKRALYVYICVRAYVDTCVYAYSAYWQI